MWESGQYDIPPLTPAQAGPSGGPAKTSRTRYRPGTSVSLFSFISLRWPSHCDTCAHAASARAWQPASVRFGHSAMGVQGRNAVHEASGRQEESALAAVGKEACRKAPLTRRVTTRRAAEPGPSGRRSGVSSAGRRHVPPVRRVKGHKTGRRRTRRRRSQGEEGSTTEEAELLTV